MIETGTDTAAFFSALAGARSTDPAARAEACGALALAAFQLRGAIRARAVAELRAHGIAVGLEPVGGCGLGDVQVRECMAAGVACGGCELSRAAGAAPQGRTSGVG